MRLVKMGCMSLWWLVWYVFIDLGVTVVARSRMSNGTTSNGGVFPVAVPIWGVNRYGIDGRLMLIFWDDFGRQF